MMPSIKTDNYGLSFEESEGELYCHLEIYKWSVSIYKQMLIEFESIKQAVGVTLWCTIPKDNQTLCKLVGLFGFFPSFETDSSYIMRGL